MLRKLLQNIDEGGSGMTEISPLWVSSVWLLAGVVIVVLNAIFHLASQPLPNWIWFLAGALLIAVGLISLFSSSRNQAEK